jgi:hypothetical protein
MRTSVAASPTSVRIIVPEEARGSSAIRIDELPGETVYLEVAGPLVTGVHQVDSPAFDSQGRLYCTMSGSRGTRAPVPLYRVTRDGVREPIAVEIANPTGARVGTGWLSVRVEQVRRSGVSPWSRRPRRAVRDRAWRGHRTRIQP